MELKPNLSKTELVAKANTMHLQQGAAGLAGGITGIVISLNKGWGFWPGLGMFILGSATFQAPLMFVFAKKRAEISAKMIELTQKENDKTKLQPSLYETILAEKNK